MNLRDWRESAGLSQRELARLAQVSRASISHVETGRYAPSPSFAGKVARALSQELAVNIHTWDLFPSQFKPLSLCQPLPLSTAQAGSLEQKDAS